MSLIPALILGMACSDYKLNPSGNGNDGGDGGGSDTGDSTVPAACNPALFPAQELGVDDTCPHEPKGGFSPVIEWSYGAGEGCLSQPIVADIDQDGMPEVIVNILSSFFGGKGKLTVLHGDGSGLVWQDTNADMGYGSPPAVADIDGDGQAEIVIVREYANSLYGDGDYTAVLYNSDGSERWESEHFVGLDFDYASAPVIRDMDHDGLPEIIIGRVILNSADGSTRGVGAHGRGCYGLTSVIGMTISESSVPAVTDLDGDGEDEVIVGNARYDADGNDIWYDPSQEDAMIGIANLDDDPEGEIVAMTYNTIRAVDTDGTVMWGPITIPTANILATPAIADLDGDGYPEIVTAGGNQLVVLDHLGNEVWTAPVTDESGATGASIFDFEGDGIPEVVYIDEVEMVAYDGPTGAVKFYSRDHASNTMFDYPTIADVDADDHAEILVCHNGWSYAMSVFGEATNTWATARKVWNQHAYDITNINDDLTVPVTATPGFRDSNTWHSAIATTGDALGVDLQSEVLQVCTDECDRGRVYVTVRADNTALDAVEPGAQIALYAVVDGHNQLIATKTVDEAIASGWTSAGLVFTVDSADLAGAEAVWVRVDDDGTGTGSIDECSEENNGFWFDGPFCG